MPNTEDFKYPSNWTVHEDVQVILQTPKGHFQLKEWKRLPRKTKKHLKKKLQHRQKTIVKIKNILLDYLERGIVLY